MAIVAMATCTSTLSHPLTDFRKHLFIRMSLLKEQLGEVKDTSSEINFEHMNTSIDHMPWVHKDEHMRYMGQINFDIDVIDDILDNNVRILRKTKIRIIALYNDKHNITNCWINAGTFPRASCLVDVMAELEVEKEEEEHSEESGEESD